MRKRKVFRPVADKIEEKSPEKSKRKGRYYIEYGEQLVEHMAKGFSFKSFAHVSKIPYGTLLTWAKNNKSFQGFKDQAEAASQHYWEMIGVAAAQGQLQKIKSEKVIKTTFLDENGNPEIESGGKPAIKQEIINKEYESTGLVSSMWIFVMRSRFGWIPEGPDIMDPEKAPPGERLKKFQLAYSLKDQPYVVRPRNIAPQDANPGIGDTRDALDPPDINKPVAETITSSTQGESHE